ncbi:MAG: ABC transporter permease [Rhodothermales bacterium]|nr:ABC transporter permease [Rhodothermales bacterium]MBO6780671.1 ABC transporter permease [Rhodothermales bacterium]
MLKSYLKVALRRFRRGGTYAILNVVGLAVGMATCSLIFLLVHHEWSFDRFHEQKDDIYRVYLEYQTPGGDTEVQAMMPPDFTPELDNAFPGIEASTRFVASGRVFEVGDRSFRYEFAEIDPDFYDMFSFEVLAGDARAAIADPSSMVITREVAEAVFGAGDGDWSLALGQVISTSTDDGTYDFNVAAVVEDFPATSSLSFEIAVSFENYDNIYVGGNNWGGRTSTYVLLGEGATPVSLEAAFPPFTDVQFASYVEGMRNAERMATTDGSYALRLQPLVDVHRNVDVWVPYEAQQHNPVYSFVLMGIGALILLIACINFMTLSVGQSTIRAREVGVRKVLGANRSQIMRQHWGESFVAATVSLVLGFFVALAMLPAFNNLTGVDVAVGNVSPILILAALVLLVMVVGTVAGGYPAAVLSRYMPASVLKGAVSSPRNNLLTQGLVVLQFTIGIGLIASTVIMTGQLRYMLEKDLGFNEDFVIAINANGVPRSAAEGVLAGMKDQLLPYEQVTHVERSGYTFTRGSDRNGWADASGTPRSAYNFGVGYDYLDLLDMEMAEGRFFSEEFPGDPTGSIVVNEALVREFGIEDPIGHVMDNWLSFIYEESPTVIGVVKDFHFQSLRNEVQPLVMNMHPNYYNFMGALLVRIQPDDVQGSLALVENAWQALVPDSPFAYSFVDEDLASQYATEQRWQQLVTYSSLLAIIIACMGLFGLAILTVGRRTKEIGIRKVLGASVAGVTGLLSREFAVLVAVASVIAAPLAWYAMNQWLEAFAFRAPISPLVFVGAAAMAMTIALGTVAVHAVRAARANPVRSLRYE